ncbi:MULTISPECIES: hypothetical protein [unclassified Capnocytophaga]|uniref:hypothetical protein n=1 Tax=unclassified Capnocytophaga TaxID=2640652 RepID=UPI000202ED15|nr:MULTISPECIES: hypothetical protein [unclassified Capnocytophaga]EGD34914.1 hypothetical protein HMPREF9071_0606 [Capnocytophaga sp. oral taxon 338 str. F0234]MEB3004645.1 hypothetical protein [Capnocytophaga sp. G2]
MTFNIETHLYQLLTQAHLKERTHLSGGIYLGNDRPDDSSLEDIILQCPQCLYKQKKATPPAPAQPFFTGEAQIIIYVPDKRVRMGRLGEQYISPRLRLRNLCEAIAVILRSSHLEGVTFTLSRQTLTPLPQIRQHAATLYLNFLTQGKE